MQRFRIILWMFIAAIASGASVGYFLYRANLDRKQLVQRSEQEISRSKTELDRITREANTRIASAEIQTRESQRRLKTYEEEQRLLAHAISLSSPSQKILRNWTTVLSIPLGISFRLPQGFTATTDTPILTISRTQDADTIMVSAYQPQREQAYLSQLSSTSTLLYQINNILLHGFQGTASGDTFGKTFLLNVQFNAMSTHTIWGHFGKSITENDLYDILSTINLRK